MGRADLGVTAEGKGIPLAKVKADLIKRGRLRGQLRWVPRSSTRSVLEQVLDFSKPEFGCPILSLLLGKGGDADYFPFEEPPVTFVMS